MKSDYIWTESAEDLVNSLCDNTKRTWDNLRSVGLYEPVAKSYRGFYGRYWDQNHGLGKKGEQDEYSTVAVNHFASILQNLINMISSQRMVFDVQMFRQDYKTRETSILAKAVLEKYFYEMNYEEQLKKALSLAMVTGTAFVEVGWETSSKPYLPDENGDLQYVGRPIIRCHDITNVYFPNIFEDNDARQPWCIIREPVNRYDLMAKYPKLKDKIMNLTKARKGDTLATNMSGASDHTEDVVWVYRAYHGESPALPRGRMVMFADDGLLLEEWENNPYCDPNVPETINKGIPVFVLRPKAQHGSFYGYSPAFDMIAVQENINLLDSTILSNQESFGIQSIAAPRSANMTATQAVGGMQFLEYDVDESGKGLPQAVQLCATPPEVFNQRSVLVGDLESISGVNATMRGRIHTSNPPSGVAAALMTANGQLANSDIEFRYNRLIEKVARFFLYTLARFQTIEDHVEVSSSRRMSYVKEFTGESLQGIYNVKISLGNPLGKSFAGKLAFAELATQQGMIKSPEQLAYIMETGEVESELQHNSSELALVRWENEQFFSGNTPPVLATDDARLHILEHKVVANDPRARSDTKVLKAVTDHIQEHMDILDMQMQDYPQLFSLITTGEIVMPQPSPQSGMAGAPEIGNANKSTAEGVQSMNTPMSAADANSGIQSGAQSALQAAERKLSTVESEM